MWSKWWTPFQGEFSLDINAWEEESQSTIGVRLGQGQINLSIPFSRRMRSSNEFL